MRLLFFPLFSFITILLPIITLKFKNAIYIYAKISIEITEAAAANNKLKMKYTASADFTFGFPNY